MKQLGDITKLSGGEVPAVDVVIGGSPCQDLSVAGKRAGLAGERSGLYMEQIRIIKEMRERDKTAGRTGQSVRPRYMVWENVPGAFSSSKGEDFAAVLEEAARIADESTVIHRPPKGKWRTAGCIMGDGFSIAWRVLDAQFWGVPQRRRRIALVADFGGQSAPEILFVRESVPGNTSAGGTARESIAGDAADCVGITNRGRSTGDVSETLRACSHGALPMVATRSNGDDIDVIHSAICVQGNCIGRADTAGCNGKGWRDDDVSYTLNTIDRPAVLDMSLACDVIRDCGGISPSLQARMGTVGNQVPLTYQMQGFGDYREGNVASSCKQRDFKSSTDLVCAVDCRNGTENADVNGTLQAKSNGGTSYNLQNVVRENMLVRRLTPLECERLQGFPDGWTDIGEWVDSKGKKRQTTDSARYKALGNSIALPPWRWVMKRLSAQYERDATMASLFDGIGGFPLIWEQLNGRGSCLWASEIDEFPIAVTKYHFGGD